MTRISTIAAFFMLAVVGASHAADDRDCRASYMRATLPYDAYCICSALTKFRATTADPKVFYLLEQTLLEHLLRLHICLSDPRIPEADKKYARNVLPKIVTYAKAHDLAQGYQPGKTYEMLPHDLILPPEMAIRDVYDSIINK